MATSFAVTFVDPETLMRQLDIAPGATVADFGCGSGYFSIAFGKAVGKEGKVICLDILPSALEAVESRAKMAGLSQIITKRANLEKEKGSGLEDRSVDWIIIKDILFQNKAKDIILNEAHRVLRPGGHILLMEWLDKDVSVGPDIQLRIPKNDLVDMVQQTGFLIQKELQAGDFHCAFVLEKV